VNAAGGGKKKATLRKNVLGLQKRKKIRGRPGSEARGEGTRLHSKRTKATNTMTNSRVYTKSRNRKATAKHKISMGEQKTPHIRGGKKEPGKVRVAIKGKMVGGAGRGEGKTLTQKTRDEGGDHESLGPRQAKGLGVVSGDSKKKEGQPRDGGAGQSSARLFRCYYEKKKKDRRQSQVATRQATGGEGGMSSPKAGKAVSGNPKRGRRGRQRQCSQVGAPERQLREGWRRRRSPVFQRKCAGKHRFWSTCETALGWKVRGWWMGEKSDG